MALLQSTLIWVVYAIVVAILIFVATTFVYVYQTPRDRSAVVTIVSIFTLTALLATVFLLPVDVALVSSTTSSKYGRRKDWATQHEVDKIQHVTTIVYYLLYSLDAILCLLVVPFTYFWYEEYDEVAFDEGSQSTGKQLWGAFKYTTVFILLTIILFLVGMFVPVAKNRNGAHLDLDYFKKLLMENSMSPVFEPLTLFKTNNVMCRWRTGSHLCPWSFDGARHYHLRYLHIHWLGIFPSVFHQILTVNIQSCTQRKH